MVKTTVVSSLALMSVRNVHSCWRSSQRRLNVDTTSFAVTGLSSLHFRPERSFRV